MNCGSGMSSMGKVVAGEDLHLALVTKHGRLVILGKAHLSDNSNIY